MERPVAGNGVGHFRAPQDSLGDLEADSAARLIAAAADLALIVDAEGVIQDVACHNDDLLSSGINGWAGRAWIDTVTVESRPKIQALLADAHGERPRARQVNHPVPGGADIPILYSAVPVGEGRDRIVAVGRDLRAMAVLQQRLVEAQQSMEREYSRLRHAETRYRLLFQLASEAVIIVDAASLRTTEANPASLELFGLPAGKIVGRPFAELFAPDSADTVRDVLPAVRATGRAEDIHLHLFDRQREVRVTVSLFRQEKSAHFLIRLAPLQAGSGAIVVPKTKSRLLTVIESLPDGFVVTSLDLRVLTVNRAFLDLAQLAAEDLTRGETLDRWLGRSEVDLNVLVASLREHGSVQRFMTVLRGEYGSAEEVEVSAVAVMSGDQPCFGFTIRDAGGARAQSRRGRARWDTRWRS